jgi:hypothetical protein
LIIRIKNHYFPSQLWQAVVMTTQCVVREGENELWISISAAKTYHEIRSYFGKDNTILKGSLQGSGLSWSWKFLSCRCECTRFLRLRSISFICWEFIRSTDNSDWTLISIIPHTYFFSKENIILKLQCMWKRPRHFSDEYRPANQTN